MYFACIVSSRRRLGISIECNFAKRAAILILKRRDAGELVIHCLHTAFHFRRVYECKVEVGEESHTPRVMYTYVK